VVIWRPLSELRRHRGATLLVTLALAGLLLTGATVPHTHVTSTIGLFNQEHDLHLAALGGVAPLADAVGVVVPVVVVAAAPLRAAPAPTTEPGRNADPRGPPLR
jgi:hypothetical protein